ncbi:MAG TPA: GNAT family N-acetyltransferase [Nocardia sp.]|uniref:GNAT family N-acetyltransferase n=1 Tax=Nocardia sp. TaxID=1821 RepID=UPI002B4B906B|nr:GNAT family N-acetyltransferase [Nocardia sp.]HLS76045.1 GNAT family N-acetyltransferase [Nocardia sp.]
MGEPGRCRSRAERSWRVVPAAPEHARGIAACHIASWREAYRDLVPAPMLAAFDVDRRADAVLRQLTARGATRTHVALDGEEVIGFATVTTREAAPCAELDALYVRASWYGSGVADELVRTAVDPALPCTLWVFADAARARAFYRRHGWLPDGARAFEEFTALPQLRLSRNGLRGREPARRDVACRDAPSTAPRPDSSG